MIDAIRHYRIYLLGTTLALAVFLYGSWVAPELKTWAVERTRDAGFVLSDLKIDGIVRSKRADVLAAVDVDDGIPLLTIDLELVRRQLEQLPWVKEASISRVLPGALNIVITERQPYALWQSDGKVSLIDDTGTIITRRGLAKFSDLMLVVGAGAASTIEELKLLLDQTPFLSQRIKTAIRVGDRRWDLVFDNGIRVKLPEMVPAGYDAVAAWQKFADLEADYHLLGREVDVIDMRLPDRMVLRVSPEGRRRMNGTGWAT